MGAGRGERRAYAAAVAADPMPTVPGPDLPAGPRTMLEVGAALGADIWWCEQVFALAGGWVATTPEAAVRVHLAELSRVAGDHARALRAELPRPAPVDPAAWVVPPSPEATAAVGQLVTERATAARLAVLHRVVLPRLLGAWTRPSSPSAAGSARPIRHARTDLAELRTEGEDLLHALVAQGGDHLEQAHDAAREAERRLALPGAMRPPARLTPPA